MRGGYFDGIFEGKTVLVTGHTGFKGSWLTAWLLRLGAEVYGFSLDVPAEPSLFRILGLAGRMQQHHAGDIRDLDRVKELFRAVRPDFVFHLAAQAVVSESYRDPVKTVTTNVLGMMHVLEALREAEQRVAAVLVTSDKCYENVEQVWGYRENDALGGKDVYSSSKGSAELIFHSYFHSFFRGDPANVRLATARAGNVIGGGDWTKDRIVADCMRAWSADRRVTIRRPYATRPWQHVLEPLSGYLTLAAHLYRDGSLRGESFNFGPKAEQNRTVEEVIRDLSAYWGYAAGEDAYEVASSSGFHEAGLLKLSCDKALFHLGWTPTLEYRRTVELVSRWYYEYYHGNRDMYRYLHDQIRVYEETARSNDIVWARTPAALPKTPNRRNLPGSILVSPETGRSE